MTSTFQLSFCIVLAMVCVLVTGSYMMNRGQGICSNDTLREALMWGGGFIIYAMFDYFILMR